MEIVKNPTRRRFRHPRSPLQLLKLRLPHRRHGLEMLQKRLRPRGPHALYPQQRAGYSGLLPLLPMIPYGEPVHLVLYGGQQRKGPALRAEKAAFSSPTGLAGPDNY